MEYRDMILHGTLRDGSLRFTAVSGRGLVEAARRTHGLSRVCTAALGRTLLCSAMMGSRMKNATDRISAIVKGGGPAGNIVCTAWPAPGGTLVKGYIENPALELPPTPAGKLDVGGAVGKGGELIVTRSLSMKEPYVGHSPMESGEIAEDFARYFAQSEQKPSLVYLGVHVAAGDGRVLSAGGVIAEALPGCPEEDLDALQARAEGLSALGGLLEKTDLQSALTGLFADMDMRILEQSHIHYRCDCSRKRLEQVLLSLGKEELQAMIAEDRGAQIRCQFCNTSYDFDAQDLEALLAEAEVQG